MDDRDDGGSPRLKMHPSRFIGYLGIVVLVLVGALLFYSANTAPLNPWKRYGVTAEWQGYGNTGLVEAVYSVKFRGITISGTACPGANYDFRLRAEDVDHDGIPELIMENNRARLVLAFRPERNGAPPEFVTLSDTWAP